MGAIYGKRPPASRRQNVSRETPARRKRLLADAKLREDAVEQVFGVHRSRDAAKGPGGHPQILGDQLGPHADAGAFQGALDMVQAFFDQLTVTGAGDQRGFIRIEPFADDLGEAALQSVESRPGLGADDMDIARSDGGRSG